MAAAGQPLKLPVDRAIPELLGHLRRNGALVVSAPPGSGKTTRIPPALLALHQQGCIMVCQPRRVAARAAARRMAEEAREEPGETFGFQTRYESLYGPGTRVMVVTEGILLRRIQQDPFLDGVAAVVLDEFHERSLALDLSLAFLREIRRSIRSDLQIVVMSATLASKEVASFLEAPSMAIDSAQHPLEVVHEKRWDGRPVTTRAAEAVAHCVEEGHRGVLCFLSGMAAMGSVRRKLKAMGVSPDVAILELHGDLDGAVQDKVLNPGSGRRIVLATNIAETSLTIPGISAVVDSGMVKVMRYDVNQGLDRLVEERISLASADQRAGRAARQGPGVCRRLWTSGEEKRMAPFGAAEIHRVDLSQAFLTVLEWGCADPLNFDWFEAPAVADLESAAKRLLALGALRPQKRGWSLTDRGQRLAAWPLPPRLGVLLDECYRAGAGEVGALACLLLQERDVLSRDTRDALGAGVNGESDLMLRIDLVREKDRAVPSFLRRRLLRTAARLLPKNRVSRPAPEFEETILARAVLRAFVDRLALRRREDRARAVLASGGGVRMAAESVVKDAPLVCALRMQASGRKRGEEPVVTWASAVEESWLEEMFPEALCEEDVGVFDLEKGCVYGWRRRTFRELVLQERRIHDLDPAIAGAVLGKAVEEHGERVWGRLVNEDTASLLQRLAFLHRHCADLGWPDISRDRVISWLVQLCAGRSRLSEVTGLAAMIEGELGRERLRLLQKEAPLSIRTPRGRAVAISYENPDAPFIRARVQALFGLVEVPALAHGRVALRVQLLAPSGRPVQTTSDLAGFWRGSYQQVRRDLRGRYPRHDWPEVPPGV